MIPNQRWLLSATVSLAAVGVSVSAQDRHRPPGLGFTRDFTIQFVTPVVYCLGTYDSGNGEELYVGGEITFVQGQNYFMSRHLVRWDGRTWKRVGWGLNQTEPWHVSPNPGVYCLQTFDDGTGRKLYIGGDFNQYWSETDVAWLPCSGFVTWDGVRYQRPLPPSHPVRRVTAMIEFDDGTGSALYIGGDPQYGHVYKYGSQGAVPIGSSMSRSPYGAEHRQFIVHDDGAGPRLFSGGWILMIQRQTPSGLVNIPVHGLVYWDGVDWMPVTGPPSVYPLGGYLGLGLGRMASYDDGTGPALYVGFDGGIWRYRYGTWENLIQTTDVPHPLHVIAVYDDGNGPALFVSGLSIPLPGVPPGQHAKFAKYQNGIWTQIGPSTTSTVDPWAASRSVVYDFGEGPDLYMCSDIGIPAAVGQRPLHMARYRGAYRDVTPVCGGDGSLSACPCGPRGQVGRGCPNSSDSQGAVLRASGKPSEDTLQFTADALPSETTCLLLQGSAYDYTPSFLGRGVLCASGTILRLAVHAAAGGTSSFPGPGEPPLRIQAAALGDALAPGSVRTYQVWYRDPGAAPCLGGPPVNLTNGIRVVW